MVNTKVRITNPIGLHLRPAGKLCEYASRYENCRIQLVHGRTVANAKSVLQVLGAGIRYGDELVLTCEGENEEQVLADLQAFILNDLNK